MSEIHDTILKVLTFSPQPLAVHELRKDSRLQDISENSLASRLCEPALKGKVWSRIRPGERYKEWSAKPITAQQRQEHTGELF